MRAIDELDEVLNGPIVLYFDADVEQRRELLVKARTIRARERKLAELATWFYQRFSMTIAARGSQELSNAEWDFVQRYEEAVK